MEPLSDPLNDRVVKDVPAPPHRPLDSALLYPDASKPTVPDLALVRKFLLKEGYLSKDQLTKLTTDAMELFRSEPNVLHLEEPVIIVGDIHGQFFDLIHMFEKVVDVRSYCKMLFLGDYVDRGIYSIEVLIFLFTLKLNNPKDIVLLRGNHESRAMTEHFTFRNDVHKRYDEALYDLFLECFQSMPLCATVNKEYICMHGGISPQMSTIDEMNKLDRFAEPGLSGLLCDLLWSDPVDEKQAPKVNFTNNKERDCSVKFGLKPVKQVLKQNQALSIIRAHQVQIDGYKMHRWGGANAFPSVITVFSAPNYCGSYNNKGAVIVIENERMNIKQYKDVDHPFHLPGDIDLFTWSMPFLAEKITDMLFNIVGQDEDYSPKTAREIEQIDFSIIPIDASQEKEESKAANILRNKVRSIARMQRIFKNLRENSQMLVMIKKMSPDGKIPQGLLLKGRSAITDKYDSFVDTKTRDAQNEKYPSVRGVPQFPNTTKKQQS